MKKFTLFIASLFLAVGAMAQTFVMPETGKYYKIKGDSQSHPWVTANTNSSGSVAVSANESDAAVFEKTANGLKAVSTGKYLGYSGGKYTYSDTEITVELVNTGSQANSEGKYAIKSGNNWMYNNNTDGIVHEADAWLDLPRLWGFIEVNIGGNGDGEDDGKIVADGVYTIDNKYNGRGSMAYGEWSPNWYTPKKEYFGLTDITLNGYAKNSVDVDPVSNKYWYVKTTDKGVYIYNIGKEFFLQNYAAQKVTCSTEIANGFVLVERTANNNKYVSVKSGDYYLSYSCGWEPNSADGSVRWLTDDEAAATLMTFTPVDATAYATKIATADALIAAFESDNDVAKAALGEAIAQAEALLAVITVGDGVGEYSGGGYTKEELVSLLGSAEGFYNSIDASTPVETIEAYIELVNGTMASYTLNMPKAGKYYTFVQNGMYITSEVNANGRIACSATKDASAIYYYDGSHLLAYKTGLYFGLNGTDWTFEAVGSNDISAIAFVAAANGAAGKYNISSAGKWLHLSTDYVNRCTNNTCAEHNFIIEEVVELPVSITDAGYATFFAPVAVEVPDGVTAHTITVNGEWATLNEIATDVIPANTGVVLEGAQGAYNFAITTTENTATSDLRGSAATTYYTEAGTYYALGLVDGVVAFYKDTFNNSRFQNNSHKAYLYVAGTNNAASYSFRFGEGTTGIENVEVENEVKTIYDLTGRRVESITAPGIYIVGGKKILVK